MEADEFVLDPDKAVVVEAFERGGGTRKTRKGRRCHAHSGSGCNHKSSLGFDKLTKAEHKEYIERQAAHQDACL